MKNFTKKLTATIAAISITAAWATPCFAAENHKNDEPFNPDELTSSTDIYPVGNTTHTPDIAKIDEITITIPKGKAVSAASVNLAEAKSHNLPLKIETPYGYNWTIKPDSITKTGKDVSLNVKSQSGNIPADLRKREVSKPQVAGSKQFKIGQGTASFGFKGTLEVSLGKQYAGKTVNFYLYNPEANSLKKSSSSLVDKNGKASVLLGRAGDILAVIIGQDLETSDYSPPLNSDPHAYDPAYDPHAPLGSAQNPIAL
ncbi:MAG: hypothetical protein FWG90_14120 [Oscillospiraceae bacterium]|nr:hypothetical protein [Oscillospiraceae bacterium]